VALNTITPTLAVNLNDKWMKTPLFIACENGHVDIVKMLINQDNCMIDVLDVSFIIKNIHVTAFAH
jgi:ankyrin repeat protein